MSPSPREAASEDQLDKYRRSWQQITDLTRAGKSFSGRERHCCYLNTGGARFANISSISGFDFADDGRGLGLVDWDHDGDLDVFMVSMFADWSDPEAAAIGWLENNGRQEFTLRTIDSTPTHLVVIAAGDLDDDGWIDVVTGGMYSHEPFDRMSRVTWWRNRWSER